MGAGNALRSLISDNASVPLIISEGKCFCVLTEVESDYDFTVYNPPNDAIIIKCDKFPTTGNVFFKGKNKESKRADYVLVSESEKVLMFFELKRSKSSSSAKNVVAQLKGAKCIMDYCESISSSFLNENRIFLGFEHKYYKGYYTSPQKRSFERKEEPDNRTPETARILRGKDAQFSSL